MKRNAEIGLPAPSSAFVHGVAGQRHKEHADDVPQNDVLPALGHEHQVLIPERASQWQYQPASVLDLGDQGRGM